MVRIMPDTDRKRTSETVSAEFNLLAARFNAGLTQRELAAACGVSLTVVQRLESRGTSSPRKAKQVADYFGVRVTDLMPLAPAPDAEAA